MGSLLLIKEVSAGAGVPGLRSASGALLVIIDQIASMKDCKLDFQTLMQDCVDYVTTIAVALKRLKAACDSRHAPVPSEFLEHAQRFSDVMKTIENVVKAYLQRGWFTRFVYGKADRDEINRLRQKMSHEIQMLGVFLQTSNYVQSLYGVAHPPTGTQGTGGGDSKKSRKSSGFDLDKIANISQVAGKRYISDQEINYRNSITVVDCSTAKNMTTNHATTAPITTYGANSPVTNVNSFQNNNHVVKNSNNDYSRTNSTYNITGPNATINNQRYKPMIFEGEDYN